MKWSIGFLGRGCRVYSYCGDRSKDLTPQCDCFIQRKVCMQNNWLEMHYAIHKHQIRHQTTLPFFHMKIPCSLLS